MSHANIKHQSNPALSKANPCDCTSHQKTCCQLDCLVQPKFFCGQLLTDTDLNQLLAWSKSKHRLSRFHHGWGVVCGLGVHYEPGKKAVMVSPGYALDCCGRDIIVCENTSLLLDDACYTPPDPCATPGEANASGGPADSEKIDYFGWEIPKSEIREKVLVIRYAEVPADFQTAFGHSKCDGKADSRASRMRESFTLTWEEPRNQQEAAVNAWKKKFMAWREVVDKYIKWQVSSTEGKSLDHIKRWLVNWIDGYNGLDVHSLYQFYGLRDGLCVGEAANEAEIDQFVTKILFWLVQDYRNHFLNSECFTCLEDDGVPLARVCLHVSKGNHCKVLSTDPYPPYRRLLSLDRWPALPGFVNAASAIWQTPEQARELLVGLGLVVHSDPEVYQLPSTPDALLNDLECDLHLKRGDTVVLQVFDAKGCLGERVIGIRVN